MIDVQRERLSCSSPEEGSSLQHGDFDASPPLIRLSS